MTTGTRQAPPRAIAMLESLRGLGYSTAAAIADIVDNSVSAMAKNVWIDFAWSPIGSRVSILDDGRGMSDSELEGAMRLGNKSPLDDRAPHELGRFGMGLKTASLSQCRRLTVASRKSGLQSCLRWDLDALAREPDGGWLLYEGPASNSEAYVGRLQEVTNGTLVLWEQLDRIVTPGYSTDDFNNLIDGVEAHLAMVFHRLLISPRSLRISINGKAIKPWDPFMEGHPAKVWESPVQKRHSEGGSVAMQCHVLPHGDKLTTAEASYWAGPQGWTAQQGFYIYRNERLLVSGGWLGLGDGRSWNREEFHRLARIRLDIPNSADAAWKIDIRKATARPPVSVRSWLTALASDTRQRARKVYAFRGTPVATPGAPPVEQAWRVERLRSGLRYRIDPKHPGVASVLDAVGERKDLVLAMLRIIEETVPVQRIWLDAAEAKEIPKTQFEGQPDAAVCSVVKTMYADLVERRGISPEAAKRILLGTQPFNNFPDLVNGLP